MPTSEKGRRAAFAEVSRRAKGKGRRSFEGMDDDDLEKYAHSPLHKKMMGKGGKNGKGGKKMMGKKGHSMPGRPSAQEQADALKDL